MLLLLLLSSSLPFFCGFHFLPFVDFNFPSLLSPNTGSASRMWTSVRCERVGMFGLVTSGDHGCIPHFQMPGINQNKNKTLLEYGCFDDFLIGSR